MVVPRPLRRKLMRHESCARLTVRMALLHAAQGRRAPPLSSRVNQCSPCWSTTPRADATLLRSSAPRPRAPWSTSVLRIAWGRVLLRPCLLPLLPSPLLDCQPPALCFLPAEREGVGCATEEEPPPLFAARWDRWLRGVWLPHVSVCLDGRTRLFAVL